MIIKDLSRRNIGGAKPLLSYILRYVLTEKVEPELVSAPDLRDKRPFIIRHNVKSNDLKGIVQEFLENEKGRIRKTSAHVALHHTIISFSANDSKTITDKMLRAIARKYIELRSPNSLFAGTKHTDRSHIHLHLAMSSCDLSGRSNRISRNEFAELKVLLQEYQQHHHSELTHSIVQHGRAKAQQHGITLPGVVTKSRMTEKESLMLALAASRAKSRSLQEFLECLQPLGYTPYYRGQEKRLTGLQLGNGRKFRFERLGYGEKIAELNSLQAKQDKELRQFRDIRSRSQKLELDQEQSFERTLDKPIAIGTKRKNEAHASNLPDCVYTGDI